MILKRIARVAAVAVCALISLLLLAVLSNRAWSNGSAEFRIVPKNWGLSVRQLEILSVHYTNSAEIITNRVSRIGPIIFTEFNH
jgi:hypothetical protein